MRLKREKSYIDISDEVGRTSEKRSKAGKKAKNKGSTFERRMAKSLGDWWGSKFYRTPQSGGSVLKEGYELAGDITTPDSDFRLHVECKNQECWTMHGFLTSEKSSVWKWWQQTLDDCPADRIPTLVFTKNHVPVWVMLPFVFWSVLNDNICHHRVSNGQSLIDKSLFSDSSTIAVRDTITISLDRFTSIPKNILVKTLQDVGVINE